MLFQAAFNLFLPALVALLPDQVPDARKGTMAALLAMGPPLGLGLGAMVAGAEHLTETSRYLALATIFLGATAPLVLFWREPAHEPGSNAESMPAQTPPPEHKHRARRDFARVWTSRLLIQIAVATNQGYILFFLGRAMATGGGFPDGPPESLLGGLLFMSTSVSIITATIIGVVSDKVGRRKHFVTVSGVLVGLGMAIFSLWPAWPGILLCQALYGLGLGLYSSAEVALAAELLPSRDDAGRDLAILNLGNTLPQAIAPVMALAIISLFGGGYSVLFLCAAGAAFAAAAAAARIESMR